MMQRTRLLASGAALMLLGAIALAQQPSADLILTNGKIITVDDKFTIAQAVAVKSDRIFAVGTNQQISQMAGAATRRIDLRGRAGVPGRIDNHMHLLRAGTTWTNEGRLDGVEAPTHAPDLPAPRG